MPCCLLTIVAFFPRIALVLMWLFAYAEGAFDSFIWPILGFFFMPYTTCVYAVGMTELGGIRSWALVLMVFAVVVDVAHMTSGGIFGRKERRRRLARD